MIFATWISKNLDKKKDFEELVTEIEHSNIITLLNAGLSVVIDATMAQPFFLKKYFNLFYNKPWDLKFELIEIGNDLSLEEVQERNSKRGRVVPSAVVESIRNTIFQKRDQFIAEFKSQVEKYNLSRIKPIINKELQDCIIFDIDGTLTHIGGRQPFDFSKVSQDKPNEAVISLIDKFNKQGAKIIFLSGRSDICADDTVSWIKKHCGDIPEPKFVEYDDKELKDIITDANSCPVLLRKNKDFRKGFVVKREIFEFAILPYFNPILALDDTDKIIDLWEYLGVPVWKIVGDSWVAKKK